jgi:hypothetical protein
MCSLNSTCDRTVYQLPLFSLCLSLPSIHSPFWLFFFIFPS